MLSLAPAWKKFTVLHTLTVLSCMIIPVAYETLITGKVIAPSKPPEYHNVYEFLNVYDKIVFPTTTSYAADGILQSEFAKCNITNEYKNRVEILYKIVPKIHKVIKFLKQNRTKEGFFMHSESHLIDETRLFSDPSDMHDDYPCSILILEHKLMLYSLLNVTFLKEAQRIHSTFWESGLLIFWDGLSWWNHFTVFSRKPKTSQEFNQNVTFANLERFIATWTIASGMCVIILTSL